MKLVRIRNIEGRVRVVTGLHIGAGKESMEIGGLDQPVIRHPHTKEPYIPGSSLKGKMRALLETRYFIDRPATREHVAGRGMPCGCGQAGCPACMIFGTSSSQKGDGLGPTRIIVRDAVLAPEFSERFSKGELPMEVKYENTIHRVKGTAENPRPLERVPAGVEFGLNISFKVFEGDGDELLDYLYKGLRLVELDALGGSSSRGSGQVKFAGLACDGEPLGEDFLEKVSL